MTKTLRPALLCLLCDKMGVQEVEEATCPLDKTPVIELLCPACLEKEVVAKRGVALISLNPCAVVVVSEEWFVKAFNAAPPTGHIAVVEADMIKMVMQHFGFPEKKGDPTPI